MAPRTTGSRCDVTRKAGLSSTLLREFGLRRQMQQLLLRRHRCYRSSLPPLSPTGPVGGGPQLETPAAGSDRRHLVHTHKNSLLDHFIHCEFCNHKMKHAFDVSLLTKRVVPSELYIGANVNPGIKQRNGRYRGRIRALIKKMLPRNITFWIRARIEETAQCIREEATVQ